MRAQVGRERCVANTYAAVRPARATHVHAVLYEPSGACDVVPAVHALLTVRLHLSKSTTRRLCGCFRLLRRFGAPLHVSSWLYSVYPIGALASSRSLLYTLACIPCRVASALYVPSEGKTAESMNERHIHFPSDRKCWGCLRCSSPGRGGQCNAVLIQTSVMQGCQAGGRVELHAS